MKLNDYYLFLYIFGIFFPILQINLDIIIEKLWLSVAKFSGITITIYTSQEKALFVWYSQTQYQ